MSSITRAVEHVGRITDRVVRPPVGITVLIYHRVGGETDSAVDLEPDVFERQLEMLAAHHRVISLDAAVDEIRRAQPSGWSTETPDGDPEPGVVVTFDDGTADFVDVVAPALERHRIPATLYAATGYVDRQEPFPWGAPPASWSGLADVADSGLITIESHTHSHVLLDRVDEATVRDELDRSIDLIGEHVGTAPRHFAYPKAVPGSPSAEVEVRRRFDTAALARNRVNRHERCDLHRLWRTPIRRGDDMAAFERRLVGGHRLEGELRALTTPLRHRRATS